MLPKKQHFVPECYLKHFTRDGQLRTLNIGNMRKGYRKEVRSATPAQVCYLPDYYTIQSTETQKTFRLDAYSALHIEQHIFSAMENKYSSIIQLLLNQPVLLLRDATDLVDFIIQMKIRNPYFETRIIGKNSFDWVETILSDLQRLEARNGAYAHLSAEKKQDAIDQLKDRIRNNSNFAKEIQQRALIERSKSDSPSNIKLRDAILKSGWQIFEAPETGPYFITSDNPGVSVSKGGIYHNSKFNEEAFFFFPLSPRLCLVITDIDDDVFDYTLGFKSTHRNKLDAGTVIHVNNSLIQVANNLLIASDDWYLSQIHDNNAPVKT